MAARSVDHQQADPTDWLALPPQALMFVLMGEYAYGHAVCVYSGSVIDVLAQAGVSEHAARSTLTRMVNRGLLRRQRVGRKMYWGLTDRGTRIVQDGRERALKTGAVNYDWDGTWTLLAFSLPDSWQRQRHDLRSQLAWVGFGPLQGGLWIAPGAAEVDQIVAGLGLEAHVRVFRARTHELTDIGQLVRDAYDLRGLASRYEDFLKRWDHSELPARAPDPLVAQLTLIADWLQVIRRDPHLPVEHLPADWPAVHAQATFMRLRNALLEPAAALAQQVLDTIPVDTESLDEEPASA